MDDQPEPVHDFDQEDFEDIENFDLLDVFEEA